MHWTPCTWIQTASGKKLDYLKPDPAAISIEDIATGLARLGRFANQTSQFYSVAEHSWRVANFVRERGGSTFDQLVALLHDAPEAYAMDLPRPLKILWPGYQLIEERLWAAISRKLLGEAVVELPPVVRYCDELALATEARDLFVGGPMENWTQSLPGPDAATIVPLGMQQARAMFMSRYTSLLLQLGIGGPGQGVA